MNKSKAIFKLSLIELLTEKEVIFIWSLSSAMGLITIMATWLASDKEIIGGYTKSQLVSYYFFMYIISQIIGWYICWGIRESIMNGSISNFLIKPLNYIKYLFIHELSYKIINMATQIIVGTILIIIIRSYLEFIITPKIIIEIIPVLIIGIGINFLSHFILGCTTFFFLESHFIIFFYEILSLTLNGLFIPLSFFPNNVLSVIKYSPFRFTYSLPAELIFNKLDSKEYLISLIIGVAWVLILAMLAYLIWKKGLKKYSAYGS